LTDTLSTKKGKKKKRKRRFSFWSAKERRTSKFRLKRSGVVGEGGKKKSRSTQKLG